MSDSPTPATPEPTGQDNRPLPPTVPRGSVPALVLFALGLASVVAAPFCTRDQPLRDETLQRVAQGIRDGNGQAFILVHPPWRTDVEDALEQALPGRTVGLALPQELSDGRKPVIAVLWPHAPDPGALRRFPVEKSLEIDGVEVRFYAGASRSEPAAQPAVTSESGPFSLPGSLRTAQVSVQWPGRRVDCNAWDPSGPRWVCPGMNEWNFVGMISLPVGGSMKRCLWAHPTTDAALSITFPSVGLGSALRLGHGLRDGAAGAEGAADLDVDVTAGSARKRVHHENSPGWRVDELPTEAGKVSDVTLSITTPHDGARHFCVMLEVVP